MTNLCPQLSQLLPLRFYSRCICKLLVSHGRLGKRFISILLIKISWILSTFCIRIGSSPIKNCSIWILGTPHIPYWLRIISITWTAFPRTIYLLYLFLKRIIPKSFTKMWFNFRTICIFRFINLIIILTFIAARWMWAFLWVFLLLLNLL